MAPLSPRVVFCSLTKHSGGVRNHWRRFGCGLRHKPPSLCQQGRTEKLNVKPPPMVTFTKRSTRCLPSKERWLGRKGNHRPRLQEAYQKFCLGFCLCCFNVFPSVLTCTQIGEPNLSCSISWEMQKRPHNFQLERGPMSSKRMDPAFNTLPPPLVVHDPCDASGNATDF